MGSRRSLSVSLFFLITLSFLFSATASAQSNAVPRIVQRVDDSQLTVLRGNVHPMAQAKFDQGAAPDSLPMNRMMLVLQRSPQLDHSLITLLDAQQDKNSPSYHQWLTPDEFGQQFGPSDSDVQTVTAWLQLHGFQVTRVSHGRTIIEFDGTAGQVQQAFHTSIHSYMVNGEQHWANSSDPQIPLALAPVVAGPVSMNNFPRQAQSQYLGLFSKSKTSPKITPIGPNFTFPDPTGQSCGTNCYAVSPYDFATIYNVLPLWNAGTDGSGQTIAIVGRTNINVQDAHDFRALFGLPTNDPVVVLNGPDPGINGDEGEADIDVQWSGAVAKNATIKLVVSESTETTDGIDLSAEYIVDNNLAGVMSESYGLCELGFGTAGNQFYNGLWEQAAAQGITVMVSTGDNGAAGCDANQGSVPQPAQFGTQVNGIASTPFNVAVGGTDFNDFSNPQTYWNPSNDPTTQQSAIGYIPETTWNDSCTNGLFAMLQGGTTNPETNCNNASFAGFVDTIGGSGGVSNCINGNGQSTTSCTQGYAKPSWQTGFGTGSTRNLPDVSLFASNGFVGNFYVVCQSDLSQTGMCDTTNAFFDLAGYGGTSVASPAFAGIMALVNQKTGSRQGQANYVLYKLATSQPTSFHDIAAGSTIAMPCTKGSPNCVTSVSSHSYGILSGYSTATGYDQATGLGSVNAQNLVNNWSTVTFTPSTTTLSLNPTSGITHGGTVNVTIGVSPSAATGDVSLITSTGKGVVDFPLSAGAFLGNTTLLPGGTYTVHAHYAGNGIYASSDSAPVSLTIAPEASTTSVRMITFNSQGITNQNATTAPYGSPYILRFDVKASSGTVCGPLANCPTGTLTVTDNGSPLDPAFFNGVLNSLGYSEDQPVQLGGGINNIVATYPGDGSFSPSTSPTDVLTITPATTTMSAVTTTATSLTVGASFMVSTTVNTSSSGLAPSGTVTFLANGTPLTGTVSYTPMDATTSTPASLTATLTTSLSSIGTFPLTATYAGDTNYSSAAASGPTVNVSNFSLSVNAPTLTISSPGGSGMLMLTVTGQSGYSGTINFTSASCSGLPRESMCSFNPPSVTGNGTTTVTVTTTSASAARRAALNGSAWWLTGLGPAAFGMMLIGGNRRKRWTILLSLVMIALLLILPACGGGGGSSGGGGDPGTPTGSYQVIVTGTTGGATATTSFGLTVQ